MIYEGCYMVISVLTIITFFLWFFSEMAAVYMEMREMKRKRTFVKGVLMIFSWMLLSAYFFMGFQRITALELPRRETVFLLYDYIYRVRVWVYLMDFCCICFSCMLGRRTITIKWAAWFFLDMVPFLLFGISYRIVKMFWERMQLLFKRIVIVEVTMEKDRELLLLAEKYKEVHEKILGVWKDGNVKSAWKDEEGNLHVKYSSGNIWTYAEVVDFAAPEVLDLEFW